MQNKSLKSIIIFNVFPVIAGIFMFSSCWFFGDKEDKDPFSNLQPEKKVEKYIDGYYSASLGESSNPKSGKNSVYIDFSDGLIQAYTKNPQNVQIIQALTNKLVNPNIEWFALGSGKINSLQYNSNQLFNKVSDPKQYKDIMAPIQETLKKITQGNSDALFVTDYEEYTTNGVEQFENYPKSYFINWLKKGNSITFFYTDYQETNKKTKLTGAKHLYFTVFTKGKANENSMISMVRDALQGRGFSTKEFTMNNNPFTVTNGYGGKDFTGLQNKQFNQWKNLNINACLDNNLPYEVIGINKVWNEDVDKYVKDIITNEDGIFLEKLYLNASDQSSYKLKKVSVKVYDVTKDYTHYAQCQEAKNNQPKMTKNKAKDQIWSDESKKNPIISTCYKKDKTELKNEWIYKASEKTLLNEVFSYDKKIFSGHLKNSPEKIELITIFDKNYNLKNLNKSSSALIRIDFVIEEAIFNSSNSQLNDFQWSSITKSGKINNSLAEAIRNTLQEPSVSPKGKILYSYYVKFANSK